MAKNIFLAFLLTLFFTTSTYAEKTNFRVLENSSIEVRGLKFSGFDSYVRSNFFREQGMRCGAKPPLPSTKNLAIERAVNDCTLALTIIQEEYWPTSFRYVMPVWFHVIYKSNGTGNISDERIKAQIQVLNEDYGALFGTMGDQGFNTHIQFELVGITRTQNDAWFDEDRTTEKEYKPALMKDTTQYINVYTNTASGYLGYAYYPQGAAGEWWDGIVLNHESVGGRNNGFNIYDQGRTLVHEMGHYLGLLHTFEGGSSCDNSYAGGDLVRETPAESVAHYECSQTTTCSSPDPIHNYMNYVDDECMDQFNSEQGNRTVCSLVNYRPDAYRIFYGSGKIPPWYSTLPPWAARIYHGR